MFDKLDFSGKTVLVVGGASGIGNGIARAFLGQGAEVHVCGTRGSAADYSGDDDHSLEGLRYHQLDVLDPTAVERFVPELARLDVLVLSQGLVMYNREEFKIANFRNVLEVNLTSLMDCAVKFFPLLEDAKGSLLIVSSTAAFHSTKGNPAYNASKAGAVGLTRTLGEAWAPSGVRVNGIAPGMTITKLTKVTTEHPTRAAKFLETIPCGRFGVAEDMGGVALFLASPMAGYIYGQTIVVDGGLTL
ncbi:SDR family NAD(P)-dependent oxidoreductase [Novosphingobium colocasiae]|uniref:Oxidoreductase n=1 Tax=Novosphingobium colocasiae TaxID=1256513 RepID=A0A918UJV7_9SPHN|nr:SDR family oxidoreductase [Novosphingobium colocasiae]GGZ15055.1 oxidoreductase [Novosphingobium colocasiae]